MKRQFKKGDTCYIIHENANMIVEGTVVDYHPMKVAQKKWLKNKANKKTLRGIGYGWPDQDMVQVSYLNDELPVTIWREIDSVKKDPKELMTIIPIPPETSYSF